MNDELLPSLGALVGPFLQPPEAETIPRPKLLDRDEMKEGRGLLNVAAVGNEVVTQLPPSLCQKGRQLLKAPAGDLIRNGLGMELEHIFALVSTGTDGLENVQVCSHPFNFLVQCQGQTATLAIPWPSVELGHYVHSLAHTAVNFFGPHATPDCQRADLLQ